MNENTSQLRRIILSVFAIMIAGIVWAFTPVGIPGKFVKVNPDSVFYLNAPSAKAIYDYSDANAVNRITIFTDANSQIRVAEEAAFCPRSGIERMDSLMFDPEGNQFRSVLKSEVNGQTKDDMVYEAEERTLRWNHHCNLYVNSDMLVGTNLDDHGNWTELHKGYGGETMGPEPIITRENFYSLTAGEERMLQGYENVLQDINTGKAGNTGIGLLLLLTGLGLGLYVLLNKNMDFRRQALLGGWLAGPVAIVGFYAMWENMRTLFGDIPGAVAGAVFILLMCYYFRVIIIRFEDNEELDNGQVTTPFVLAKVLLLFVGWMVGGMLWGTWWAALLTTGAFALPIFAVPDRGERCPKCHKMGKIRKVETIVCGQKTKERTSGNYIISTTYERYKTRRTCSHCGYSYLTSEQDGRVLAESRREIPRQARPKATPASPSSAEPKEDRTWLGCANEASGSGVCLYESKGYKCPFNGAYDQTQCRNYRSK
mgnify:FL=1|jgi:hypothetical protein